MIFTNSKGIQWFLHSKENHLPRNKAKVTTYYFKKEKGEGYCDSLPPHLTVKEVRNGLPVVKRL